ncbi:MAG: phospholipid carrier-dependent glycosyltransferase [Spirulinaceae cyanobacterium RM2_2_10]|nr:phospholipid carrier-dependent glycosyltransferase [Spirulinaceae cyanobacterium SM2_1_0]NJO20203.1 phospholipid carrier-dependent glycosyltransferase [Spirulinaceae cyanobacterium RM2_2_10]
MTLSRQPFSLALPWFRLALGAIVVASLGLRFWNLGQFNTLVFDEVYYPVFANRYLSGEPVYNAHPPLSQLLLAASMWLGSHLPIGQDLANTYTGSLRSTFSYRWLNALTGACIPWVVGAIAYHLTYRYCFALLAALFVALDGLFLVESRYGLNNVYLVLFGLLGQLCVLRALEPATLPATLPRRRVRFYAERRDRWLPGWSAGRSRYRRHPQLIWAGLCFGAAAGIKWNGLGFLLGIYLVWAASWLLALLAPRPFSGRGRPTPTGPGSARRPDFTQLNILHVGGYLGILPAIAYWASWQPHLWLNPKPGFWEMQQRILSFHQAVGSGPDVHPYCSPWYSWLLMWRPVAYFYHTARDRFELVPNYPELPAGVGRIIYDVHAMGNPWLWWLSTAAIALLLVLLVQPVLTGRLWQSNFTPTTALSLFLIGNYAANLLPWLRVTRCTFLYHYMGALTFALLALAWLVDNWLQSPNWLYRQLGLLTIGLAIAAFCFWLPIYLGLPLTPDAYRLRMWFENWI